MDTNKTPTEQILTTCQDFLEVWTRLQEEQGLEADAALYQMLYPLFRMVGQHNAMRFDGVADTDRTADCMHAAAVAAGITSFNFWKASEIAKRPPLYRLRRLFMAAYATIATANRSADPGTPGRPSKPLNS